MRTSPDSAPGSAAVLMYHRVAVLSPDTYRLCIAPDVFREHMAALQWHYVPVSLMDLMSAVKEGGLPPRAVAVTFDDGCIDNLTVASAILLEFGIPATFFITTDRLTEKHEFWWDALERIFAVRSIPGSLDLWADGDELYRTSTDEERADAQQRLAEKIRNLGPDVRNVVMARLADWSGLALAPRETHRPMVADEVLDLSRRPGHTVGAHSIHHLSLPALLPEDRRREVYSSKETLERLLGVDVTAFAYPYGHYDQPTMRLVEEGFSVAVTATSGTVAPGMDPVALPRLDASQLTPSHLMVALDEMLNPSPA